MLPLGTTAPLSVESALRETLLRDCELVAGASGLGRQIEGVAVLDVADLEALCPNQLVLVSAYALLETDLRLLVRELRARRAGALGVKLEPYWSRMPGELVAAADAGGMPLLALPRGRFEDLVNPLLSAIVERQAAILRSTAEFHRALTDAALRDDALGSTATILAEALGVEVATLDEDGELLAAAGGGERWADLLADATSAVTSTGRIEHSGEQFLVAPISARGRRYGAVCVRAADLADEAFARAAITEAAVVTGMQLLGRRHVEAVHLRFEHELLDDLVGGRLGETEARERAERLGWPVRRPYVVLFAAPAGKRAGMLDFVADDEHVAAAGRALRAAGFAARTFNYRRGLAILLHFSRTEDPRRIAEAAAARLARARGVAWGPEGPAVTVSRAAHDIARLPEAAREARLTMAMSQGLRRQETQVAHFDDLGATRLLANVSDRRHLLETSRARLGVLGDPTDGAAAELLETLAALLTHNLRVTKAADDLFFHYNTVRNRLARLREIYGERLTTPEGQLELWLAIVALRLAQLDSPPTSTCGARSARKPGEVHLGDSRRQAPLQLANDAMSPASGRI
jgi:purine catabolism regulator